MKKIFFVLIISLFLVGCVAAAELIDFKIDDSLYTSNYTESDMIVYFDDTNSSGLCIFKYYENETEETNDDSVDNVVKDEGNDYLVADEDFKLDKNSDNTANFTDNDENNMGVVEVVEVDNEKFVIVFWASNGNNADYADLLAQLNDFNKENNLAPVAF